jgi:hypothetical protein
MAQKTTRVLNHFHIHWSSKDSLDWERFASIPEALARAAELAQPNEKFTIEEASTDCSVCPQTHARTGSMRESNRLRR